MIAPPFVKLFAQVLLVPFDLRDRILDRAFGKPDHEFDNYVPRTVRRNA